MWWVRRVEKEEQCGEIRSTGGGTLRTGGEHSRPTGTSTSGRARGWTLKAWGSGCQTPESCPYHDAVLDSSHRRRPLAQPQVRHPEVHLGAGVLRIEARVRLERREAFGLLTLAVVVERRLSVLEVLHIGRVVRGGAGCTVRGRQEQGGDKEDGR